MDHKPRKIVNDLRLISSETNLAYYTENFVFSALHKDRLDNQDDGNFWNKRHFSLLHSLRSNTTTNFPSAARAYSQRYHLLLSFSNHNDDHNDDFKKLIGLVIKTTALHVHHVF